MNRIEFTLVLLALWSFVSSVVAFIAFAWDKRAARHGRRRIPESRLHCLELLGGFPGALCAIFLLHHKSSKPRFLLVTGLATLLNTISVCLIIMTVLRFR